MIDNDGVRCPTCGAYGTMQCSTVSGRDHKARWVAEDTAGRKQDVEETP